MIGWNTNVEKDNYIYKINPDNLFGDHTSCISIRNLDFVQGTD